MIRQVSWTCLSQCEFHIYTCTGLRADPEFISVPCRLQNLSHSGKKQRLGSAAAPGSDTEWPRPEPPEGGDRQHRQLEEHQHLSFVQTHLASLVEVGSSLVSTGRHGRLSLEECLCS